MQAVMVSFGGLPALINRYDIDIQKVARNKDAKQKGFEPMPIRRRIEATFGTLANRFRRLTRNLE